MLDRSTLESCPWPLDPIGELSLSLHYRWEPERLFVIITTHIDESGTHGDSPVIIMGALVAPAWRWWDFDQEWRKALKKAGVSHFHERKLKGSKGDFKGWSLPQKNQFLDDTARVITRNCKFGFSVVMTKAEYDQHYKTDRFPRGARMDSMYGLCFRYALAIVPSRSQAVMSLDRARYDYVLESGHPNAGDAERIFHEVKSDPETPAHIRETMGSISFVGKKEVAGVQGADGVAFNAFHAEQREDPPFVERALEDTYADDQAKVGKCPLYRIEMRPDLLSELRAEIDQQVQFKKARRISRSRSREEVD